MTISQFDRGYWYATELKRFAKGIGIPSPSRLRKDELESAIRGLLGTGAIAPPLRRTHSSPEGRDVERGLSLDLRVIHYINDAETKRFLDQEARKLAPGLKRRSGVRYRLNRWREAQILSGVRLTYGDLVREYVRLNQSTEPFAKIPHVRYINFMSDFMAGQTGATRAQAIKAWSMLKAMDVPKAYSDWVRARSRKSR
jgi:hypothetical protein